MPTRVLAALDARMGEVYVAAFALEADAVHPLSPERVMPPEAVELPESPGPWYGRGTGFAAAGGCLAARLGPRLAGVDAGALPHAAAVARLAAQALARGEVLAPERVEPAYLRDQVALTLAEQAALRAGR